MKTLNKWMMSSVFCLFIFLVSCSKASETGTMTVRLADRTDEFEDTQPVLRSTLAIDAIYLDVKSCHMKYYNSPSSENWVTLSTNAGIYNLFDLNDDASIVLVNEVDMPAGEVGQMRLILGSNNSIVIDGNSYALKVPSAEESGLKIELNEAIHFHDYITVVLDFDQDHQIVELGNGGYILKPVMHVDVIYQH